MPWAAARCRHLHATIAIVLLGLSKNLRLFLCLEKQKLIVHVGAGKAHAELDLVGLGGGAKMVGFRVLDGLPRGARRASNAIPQMP